MKTQNLHNITANKMDAHIDVLTINYSISLKDSFKKAWVKFNKNLDAYGAAAAAAIRN